MRVLIVEGSKELGQLWARSLVALGMNVTHVQTQAEAVDLLRAESVQIILLNLILKDGSAFAVADFASYRQPEAKVIFVTNTSFFSDGSIFRHIPNACAFLQSGTPPDDLAAMVDHYAAAP